MEEKKEFCEQNKFFSVGKVHKLMEINRIFLSFIISEIFWLLYRRIRGNELILGGGNDFLSQNR